MKYVIKDVIGYIGEIAIGNWHKIAKTKKAAQKFNTIEEAQNFLNKYYSKKAQKFMTIEEVE